MMIIPPSLKNVGAGEVCRSKTQKLILVKDVHKRSKFPSSILVRSCISPSIQLAAASLHVCSLLHHYYRLAALPAVQCSAALELPLPDPRNRTSHPIIQLILKDERVMLVCKSVPSKNFSNQSNAEISIRNSKSGNEIETGTR